MASLRSVRWPHSLFSKGFILHIAGGLLIHERARVAFEDCDIYSNTTARAGGGLQVRDGSTSVSLYFSRLHSNTAPSGGAFSVSVAIAIQCSEVSGSQVGPVNSVPCSPSPPLPPLPPPPTQIPAAQPKVPPPLWPPLLPPLASPAPPANVFTDNSALATAARAYCNDSAAAELNHGPIAQWDVSAITSMDSLFQDCTSFNGNLSAWDVRSVTDMDVRAAAPRHTTATCTAIF